MIDKQALKMLSEDENKAVREPSSAKKVFGNVYFVYTKVSSVLHAYMQKNAEYYDIPLESSEQLDDDKLASFLNDVTARLKLVITIHRN